jgi:hypothetical protein
VRLRSVRSDNDPVSDWIAMNGLRHDQVQSIADYTVHNGTLLYKLVHGAAVYDLHGKNFSLLEKHFNLLPTM